MYTTTPGLFSHIHLMPIKQAPAHSPNTFLPKNPPHQLPGYQPPITIKALSEINLIVVRVSLTNSIPYINQLYDLIWGDF